MKKSTFLEAKQAGSSKWAQLWQHPPGKPTVGDLLDGGWWIVDARRMEETNSRTPVCDPAKSYILK